VIWDWTAPLVAAVRNQIVVNLLRQFERMPVRPSFRLSLVAHACLFYRAGMSVAVFVPSVSLSLYLPILFCHTNCAILPLPPEPMWLPSCSLSLSRSMIFILSISVSHISTAVLLFHLIFTINTSAYGLLIQQLLVSCATRGGHIRFTFFSVFSSLTIYPCFNHILFLVSSVLTGKLWQIILTWEISAKLIILSKEK
jgi:hypothetical protein